MDVQHKVQVVLLMNIIIRTKVDAGATNHAGDVVDNILHCVDSWVTMGRATVPHSVKICT